jgi:5-(carboxyamino)imidazole ribonucleotide mutase
MAIEYRGVSGDQSPVVAIVMGSDSDWRIMSDAGQVLEEFEIPYCAQVKSAHRMPFDMLEFAKTAEDTGYRVIIAGAGGAAHLPGMVASATNLPVIGVPVSLKNLDGMDSLLSIVQMPSGVPVAAVSIDGARNAGILAARILSTGSDELAVLLKSKLRDFATGLRNTALKKGEELCKK